MTLHCLTGCAIGEVTGMVLGTMLGIGPSATVALAVVLAFAFGYALTMRSLLAGGRGVGEALRGALVADTLSISVMEFVDNAVMLLVPGALGSHVDDPRFWGTLALALFVAYWAAVPVNAWMLERGMRGSSPGTRPCHRVLG